MKDKAQPAESSPIFSLSESLREDVQNLENSKNELVKEFRIKQAELLKMESDIQGLEASIYAIFKTEAIINHGIGKDKRIKFLGDFKYQIVDIEKGS